MSQVVFTSVPESIDAGTTVEFVRRFANYSHANGWDYSLIIASPACSSVKSFDGVDDGNNQFLIKLTPSQTKELNPRSERVIAKAIERVTRNGDVFNLATISIAIQPDLSALTPSDSLSQSQRILAALKARLEGRITEDMESLQVGGRSIARIPIRDLTALIARFEQKVANELDPKRNRLGRAIKVFFPPTFGGGSR